MPSIFESQFAFNLYFGLLLVFNAYWFITYFLVIRRGYIEKTFGIPMVSLSLNLAWDISGAFILPSPLIQEILNMGFVIANGIIALQLFLYWRSDFKGLKPTEFWYFWIMAFSFAFGIILIGSVELNDPGIYKVGFIDNFINSALFIAMFYRRDALLGQSIYIGLSKMIGTAAVSLSWFIFPWPGTEGPWQADGGTWLMPFLYAGIFIMDLTYVYLVYRRGKEMNIDVWRRW